MQSIDIQNFIRKCTVLLGVCLFNVLPMIHAKKAPVKSKPVFAALAVDAETGKILYQHNAAMITPPASLTKLMTLLMVFDAIDQGKLRPTDMIPISQHAASQSPCKLGLKAGSYISVQNLILAMVTKSANDAACVIGEFLGGTESAFAAFMTQRARQFGMLNTTFKTASGLPAAGQLTTARDMAILGLVTLRHYQKHFHLFGVREFCYNNKCHVNHNYRLLSQKNIKFDGIKTGFVNASGFNVIASHKDNSGRRIITVLMGGPTPALRDKRVVEIAQRLNIVKPSMYYASNTINKLPKDTDGANFEKPSNSMASTPAADNTYASDTSSEDVQVPITQDDSSKYALLLGYFGSQMRAEATARQALSLSGTNATVSTRRVRVGGRYLFQARLDQLSKEQADQVALKLKNVNIDCTVVEQSS